MKPIFKWTLLALPVIAGGIIVYYQLKKKYPQQSPIAPNNSGTLGPGLAQQSDTAAGLSTAQINAKYFPLQQGSNNQYVGELQDVLGVTIDNKFGSGTLAALQAQAGVASVTNLAQLNSIEDSILATDQAAAAVATRAAASQSLLGTAQNSLMNGVQFLTPSSDTTWYSVMQDNNGNWNRSGTQLTLTAGQVLSLSTYLLQTVDPVTGNLIINCLGDSGLFSGMLFGTNQGLWIADPTPLVIS